MNFEFYNVDTEYCNYLRNYDKNVPYTMDNKSNRPFIGIVLKINDNDYFAPLTSPKPKHLKMKNQIDFIKIENGSLGAINLNNMIPANQLNIKKVDINSLQDLEYKVLLKNQLSWCNKKENKNSIIEKCKKLYNYITNPNNIRDEERYLKIKERCCDFKQLEKISKLYNQNLHNEKIENKKPSIKDKIKEKQAIINQNKENNNCQKIQTDKNISR